ncbi:13576_t:CDS:2, partial [Racocetra fulgida]
GPVQKKIKGYTRNSVDHGFGNTKREYSRSEIWCIDQFAKVIERNLWSKIDPYCPITFHDKLCPKPSDSVIERVGRLKGTRAKENKAGKKLSEEIEK